MDAAGLTRDFRARKASRVALLVCCAVSHPSLGKRLDRCLGSCERVEKMGLRLLSKMNHVDLLSCLMKCTQRRSIVIGVENRLHYSSSTN